MAVTHGLYNESTYILFFFFFFSTYILEACEQIVVVQCITFSKSNVQRTKQLAFFECVRESLTSRDT